MEQESIQKQEKEINMLAPDQTIVLTDKDLDLADWQFNSTEENQKQCFFQPSTQNTKNTKYLPHRLISCQKNLMRIWSISSSQGIHLESALELPNFPFQDDTKKIGRMAEVTREFINRPRNHNITIIDKIEGTGEKTIPVFQEIRLNNQAQIHPRQLMPGPLQPTDHNHNQIILSNSDSARIWMRNCLLEMNQFEVRRTYLTPYLNHPRPNILSKINHQEIHSIYDSEIAKMTKKQKRLFDRLIPQYYAGGNFYSTKDFVKRQTELSFEDVNQRLYCLVFNIANVLSVAKVYDKLSHRIVKVITINISKLLIKGLKAMKLLNEKNRLKNIKLGSFDLFKDTATVVGEVLLRDGVGHKKGYTQFKLQAKNCLFNAEKAKVALKLKTETTEMIKNGCLGSCTYSDSTSRQGDFQIRLIANKPQKNKKPTQIIKLRKKKTALLDKLTEIVELGIIEGENPLIYFRDLRFIYLLDAKKMAIQQRVRYSSFDTRIDSGPYNKLCHKLLGKVHHKSATLEFFKRQRAGKKPIEFEDFHLGAVIQETLKIKNIFYQKLFDVRMAESSHKEISVLSSIEVNLTERPPKMLKNYLSVVHLDKDSFEVKHSSAFPTNSLFGVSEPEFEEWIYDVESESWAFDYITRSRKLMHRLKLGKRTKGKLTQKKIKLPDTMKTFLDQESVRLIHVHKNRFYFETTNEVSEGSSLTVFKKIKDDFELKRSIGIKRYNYQFFKGSEGEPRTFVFEEAFAEECSPKILITDSELALTHKLTLLDLPCGIENDRGYLEIVPHVLNGGYLFLKLGTQQLVDDRQHVCYLLDLENISLSRIEVGSYEDSLQNVREARDNINLNQLRLFMSIWDQGFLFLENYKYFLN